MVRWMKKVVGCIREKVKLHMKLRRMDRIWRLYGGNCFGLFPPSFYYKHSEEECRRIAEEEIASLRKALDDYIMRHKELE